MKKHILAWLAFCLSILMLASCGTPAGTNDDTTAPDAGDTTTAAPETTEPVETAPPLPDIKLDGHVVNCFKLDQAKILWASVAFDVTELTSDIVNDNIYKRNERLMAQYKFDLQETSDVNINKLIPSLAQSGDTTYSVYLNRINQIGVQALEGYFVDLNTVDTMFLNEKWWDQGMMRDLQLLGKMNFINGDLNVGNNDTVQVLFYNKGLAKDLGITGLYELVRDGKWTLDRMSEMMAKAAHDVNGDGKMTADDRYGLLGQTAGETCSSMYVGLGGSIAVLDKNGIPSVTAGTEASVKAAEKLSSLYSIPGGIYNYASFKKETGKEQRDGIVWMYDDNRCLFYANGISAAAQYMRQSDKEYGFLPNPKVDENQAEYRSKLSSSCPVFAIPVQAKDVEKTGLVLEILSRDSTESVIKDYYETCFAAKYTMDQESYEMIQIADANHVFDAGNIYDWGKLGSQVPKEISANTGTWVSMVETYKSAAEAAITKMVEAAK